MRLFVAINVDEAVRQRLAVLLKMLRASGTGSFVRPENLHITLAFLGEQSGTERARDAMDAVCAAPFSLTFGDLGRFRREGGDILWLGIERSVPLTDLHDSLNAALCKQNLPTETRPFRQHLTLGRQVLLRQPLEHETFSIGSAVLDVNTISLMRSDRVEGRLEYTELFRKSLLHKQ